MRKLMLLCGLLCVFSVSAQNAEKDRYLPKGNASFESKKYDEAEASYRISQSKFPKKAAAAYNLGNTIYKIDQPAEAKIAYAKAIEVAKTRSEKHRAYHNIGNVFMKEKNYEAAADAYKNALRNNPSDEETRYNYALAKKFLNEGPKKGNKEMHDKKPQGNEKQNQPEQGDDKSEDQNKQDPKDSKNQDPKKVPAKQPQPQELSKQRVQSLLDAVNNEERKVQNKVNSQKSPRATATKNKKDW